MLVRGQDPSFAYLGIPKLVHRLAYNGDVAAGQLAVFQGGPSRAPTLTIAVGIFVCSPSTPVNAG